MTLTETAILESVGELGPSKSMPAAAEPNGSDPTGGATLAELAAMVRLQGAWKDAERQGSLRAVRKLADALGLPAELIPADGAVARAQHLGSRAFGGAEQSFLAMLSDLRRTVRLAAESRIRIAEAVRIGAVAEPTLAEAHAATHLQLEGDPAEWARVRGALERLASRLALPLDAIPARLHEVERRLEGLSHADFGVELASFGAIKTRIRRAVRLVDRQAPRRTIDLAPAWRELIAAAEQCFPDQSWRKGEVWPLVRLAADRRFAPEALEDAIIPQAIAYQEQRGGEDPLAAVQRAVRQWNSWCTEPGLADFHLRPLTVPARAPRFGLRRFSELPAALQADWQALAERLEARSGDWADLIVDDSMADYDAEFGPQEPDEALASAQLKQSTLRRLRSAVVRAANAALDRGLIAEDELTSIAGLLRQDVLRATLTEIKYDQEQAAAASGRSYDPKNAYRAKVGRGLARLAVLAGVDGATVAGMSEDVDRIDPVVKKVRQEPDGQGGVRRKRIYAAQTMGPRHRERLLQFRNSAKLFAWLELPARLAARAEKARARAAQQGRPPSGEVVADMLVAVATAIVQDIPLRAANLASITISGPDSHLRLPTRQGEEAYLLFKPSETKTHEAIEGLLAAATVELIGLWLEHYRPLLASAVGSAPDNPHLFPAAGQGHRHPSLLNERFKQRCRKIGGFVLNLHCGRHLAGKIILDEEPQSMGLVSALLDHKSEVTTRRFYAEVNKLIAQRRYHAILAQRKSALAGRPRLRWRRSP